MLNIHIHSSINKNSGKYTVKIPRQR